MRQAGILAAAGLISLEKMPARLHQDHANARFLAEGLAQIPGIKLEPEKVVTNILIFDINGTGMNSAEMSRRFGKRNVLANGINPQAMRLVTHMDVDRAACQRALQAIQAVCERK